MQAGGLASEMIALYENNPDEKQFLERLLHRVRTFLFSLMNPSQTPRTPLEVRKQAYRVSKHFPLVWDDRGFSDKDLKWD
jgi:hypothetical protein